MVYFSGDDWNAWLGSLVMNAWLGSLAMNAWLGSPVMNAWLGYLVMITMNQIMPNKSTKSVHFFN